MRLVAEAVRVPRDVAQVEVLEALPLVPMLLAHEGALHHQHLAAEDPRLAARRSRGPVSAQ